MVGLVIFGFSTGTCFLRGLGRENVTLSESESESALEFSDDKFFEIHFLALLMWVFIPFSIRIASVSSFIWLCGTCVFPSILSR